MSDTQKSLNILRNVEIPLGKNCWWDKYPVRAVTEIFKMNENTKAGFLCKNSEFIWEETINTDFGSTYNLSIHSGQNYPYSVPSVYARDANGSSIWRWSFVFV